MKCIFGRGKTNTNKKWDTYLHINNFGYYENQSISISRPSGREDYQLIIITQGTARFCVGNQTLIAEKGCGILYKPGEKQVYSCTESGYFWVHFSGTEAEGLVTRAGITNSFFTVENLDNVHTVFRKMLDCTAFPNAFSEDMLCSIFISMLSRITEKSNDTDKRILTVINYMKSEGFNSLSTKEYAKMAKLSEYHFIRKFKKLTGCTPLAYKARIITDKAVELMENTDMNVSEISSTLGFDDSLYFSRFFKKNTGVSPNKYRQMY